MGSDNPFVQQNMCGQYCLTSILQYLGKDVTINEVFHTLPAKNMTNLSQLQSLAQSYNVCTLAANVSADTLLSMGKPAILHIPENHFIVLLPNETQANYIIMDPPDVFCINNKKDLLRWAWKGNCLVVDSDEIVIPQKILAKYKSYPVAVALILLMLTLICVGCGKCQLAKKTP